MARDGNMGGTILDHTILTTRPNFGLIETHSPGKERVNTKNKGVCVSVLGLYFLSLFPRRAWFLWWQVGYFLVWQVSRSYYLFFFFR